MLLSKFGKRGDRHLVEEAMPLVNTGTLVVVGARERSKQAKGVNSGAVETSGGLLEFHVDAESLAHIPEQANDKTFIFCCVAGGMTALAAIVATKIGMGPAANLNSGCSTWKKTGRLVFGIARLACLFRRAQLAVSSQQTHTPNTGLTCYCSSSSSADCAATMQPG